MISLTSSAHRQAVANLAARTPVVCRRLLVVEASLEDDEVVPVDEVDEPVFIGDPS